MENLLEVQNLKVYFSSERGLFKRHKNVVRAVDDVSFSIKSGEVVALVGESGCGKTTVARSIVDLVKHNEGTINFQGIPLKKLINRSRDYYRMVQFVFQDPFDSLNPRKTVLKTLALTLKNFNVVPRSEIRQEAIRLLNMVGLSPGEAFINRFPHQFSGGQRQRICIARAIAPRPLLVLADEAVSSLDVSIRAQILSLMRELQGKLGLSYLFITHDLGVVRSISERVFVMYLGQIVEEGPTEEIFAMARHPYTRALLSSSPILNPKLARLKPRVALEGDVPSAAAPPPGCRFHPRCPVAKPQCSHGQPPFVSFGEGHQSACFFAAEANQWDEVPALKVRTSA